MAVHTCRSLSVPSLSSVRAYLCPPVPSLSLSVRVYLCLPYALPVSVCTCVSVPSLSCPPPAVYQCPPCRVSEPSLPRICAVPAAYRCPPCRLSVPFPSSVRALMCSVRGACLCTCACGARMWRVRGAAYVCGVFVCVCMRFGRCKCRVRSCDLWRTNGQLRAIRKDLDTEGGNANAAMWSGKMESTGPP